MTALDALQLAVVFHPNKPFVNENYPFIGETLMRENLKLLLAVAGQHKKFHTDYRSSVQKKIRIENTISTSLNSLFYQCKLKILSGTLVSVFLILELKLRFLGPLL